MEQNIEQTSK